MLPLANDTSSLATNTRVFSRFVAVDQTQTDTEAVQLLNNSITNGTNTQAPTPNVMQVNPDLQNPKLSPQVDTQISATQRQNWFGQTPISVPPVGSNIQSNITVSLPKATNEQLAITLPIATPAQTTVTDPLTLKNYSSDTTAQLILHINSGQTQQVTAATDALTNQQATQNTMLDQIATPQTNTGTQVNIPASPLTPLNQTTSAVNLLPTETNTSSFFSDFSLTVNQKPVSNQVKNSPISTGQFNTVANTVNTEKTAKSATVTNPVYQTGISENTVPVSNQIVSNDNANSFSSALNQVTQQQTEKATTDISGLVNQASQTIPTAKNTLEPPVINTPVNHPNWSSELGDKLLAMHSQNLPSAELQLNPAHLGPITIKIGVEQNQTTISFSTQHLEVKNAIEASIPRLQEMLGNQQLNLVNVNISQQQSDQSAAQGFFQMAGDQPKRNNGQSNASGNDTTELSIETISVTEKIDTIKMGDGLLSLFA